MQIFLWPAGLTSGRIRRREERRVSPLFKCKIKWKAQQCKGERNHVDDKLENKINPDMKIIFGVFIVLIFVLLLLFAAPKILEFVGRKEVPEMTLEKAQKFFETAGGVNEVNREARVLFGQLGTNDWAFLYPQDLTNSPAISSLYSICKKYPGERLGPFVTIWPENGRHIDISFGNHWSIKHFYIFDPNVPVTFNSPSNWFQVSSNIFTSK